ncbi:MAG: hypothetical protein K2M10_08345 [Muribaculaceae bacterium]|nr:hypothetical protein [Muribaculaceae bacterium]
MQASPPTPHTRFYFFSTQRTPEFQAKHQAYVLVPQYSYITVDNKWQTMPEVDETIELLPILR